MDCVFKISILVEILCFQVTLTIILVIFIYLFVLYLLFRRHVLNSLISIIIFNIVLQVIFIKNNIVICLFVRDLLFFECGFQLIVGYVLLEITK